jgi:hypothetical protein
MKLPLIGGAYAGRTPSLDVQLCRNFYIGIDPKDSFPISLIGTPGSELYWTLGNGPIRGAFATDTYAYHVSGNGFYRNDVLKGTLSTSVNRVYMEWNGTNLLIIDDIAGYIWNGSTFTTISDPEFPAGLGSLTYQDGYFIVGGANDISGASSNQFYFSPTGTSWEATDVLSAESQPDWLVRVFTNRQVLWLFGNTSVEQHYTTSSADAPFRRLDGGVLHYGLAARHSVSRLKQGVVWLSRNEMGYGQVVASTGSGIEVLSTPQIDSRINAGVSISDAIGYTYQMDGHEFYCLTFPTLNKTLVFDGTTAEWHERSSVISSVTSRQRYNTHIFYSGNHLMGDYATGSVYKLRHDLGTEYTGTSYSQAITRERIARHLNADQQRLFFREVQISMEHGVGAASGTAEQTDPTIALKWSKDGGHTWSDFLYRAVGAAGEYLTRCVWRNLGVARDWVFWLKTTTDRPIVITDAIGYLREAQRPRNVSN